MAVGDKKFFAVSDGSLQTNLNADKLDGKDSTEFSEVSHAHDDRYYTETEVDTALSGKAESTHTHDDMASITHIHAYLDANSTYSISESTLPNAINVDAGMRIDFINNFSGGGSQYRTIITLTGYSNNGVLQLATPYNSGNSEPLYYRISDYNSNTWGSWINISTKAILSGTATPSSGTGNNGDIYIKYT